MPPVRRLSLFLRLVAGHSMLVGIFLVLQPPALIRMMGLGVIHEPFFPCQGGVFHMVMAIAYLYGAADIQKNKNMVIYAVIVKMTAALFLFTYFFFIERLSIVLLSGIIDLFMGAVIRWMLGAVPAGSPSGEMKTS